MGGKRERERLRGTDCNRTVDRKETAAVVRVELLAFVPFKLKRAGDGRGVEAVPLQELLGPCVPFSCAALAGQLGLAVVVQRARDTAVLAISTIPKEIWVASFHVVPYVASFKRWQQANTVALNFIFRSFGGR